MDIPPKRRSNRSQRRAEQRNAPAVSGGLQDDVTEYVPAPPAGQCAAWHYYWCDGHEEWHHHEESAVTAILASLTPESGQ